MGSEEVLLQDWNGFGFKYVEKSDFDKVQTHLRHNFYRDEPIHKVMGVPPERMADMDQKIRSILDLDHGTFMAFPLDDPTRVAAVLIIWIHENGKELPPFQDRSPLTGVVREVILKLKDRYSIHEERGLDIYPELFIISTDRETRGKGLATEMYRRAITKLRAQGYPIVSSTFSNPLSRKIGEKLGFKQVSRLDFNECKHEDGSPVFGSEGIKHFIVETVLELRRTGE